MPAWAGKDCSLICSSPTGRRSAIWPIRAEHGLSTSCNKVGLTADVFGRRDGHRCRRVTALSSVGKEIVTSGLHSPRRDARPGAIGHQEIPHVGHPRHHRQQLGQRTLPGRPETLCRQPLATQRDPWRSRTRRAEQRALHGRLRRRGRQRCCGGPPSPRRDDARVLGHRQEHRRRRGPARRLHLHRAARHRRPPGLLDPGLQQPRHRDRRLVAARR